MKMTDPKFYKKMNVSLWTLQWTLSLLMLSGAIMKFMPIANIASIMPWMGQVPEYMVRGLGFIDLAAAVGIVLPALMRRNRRMTLFAAAGIFLLMICAVVFHLFRGEAESIAVNIFTGILALLVGVGRWYELREAGKKGLTIC
ncbi:DoxX family protein [Dyadobacter luteus]|uniref:DoxX family protein n=1 Tax=Dyadobacter luteus TaxID=2259619 RepID=A0A3D8YE15_9BACT|nr:DoxX family protein [Dyadobacter luteus]REA62797.1 DoxX family protein [Dyadobacter luteus]